MKSCENCIYQNNIDAEWPCCKCAEYSQWTPEGEKEPEEEYDPVNKPKHYNREGAMECIDEMILLFGKETVKDFCKCNAWKYRYRAADKNGAEDLAKSDWYLAKYRELCESTSYGTITASNCITGTVPKYLSTSRACLDKSN